MGPTYTILVMVLCVHLSLAAHVMNTRFELRDSARNSADPEPEFQPQEPEINPADETEDDALSNVDESEPEYNSPYYADRGYGKDEDKDSSGDSMEESKDGSYGSYGKYNGQYGGGNGQYGKTNGQSQYGNVKGHHGRGNRKSGNDQGHHGWGKGKSGNDQGHHGRGKGSDRVDKGHQGNDQGQGKMGNIISNILQRIFPKKGSFTPGEKTHDWDTADILGIVKSRFTTGRVTQMTRYLGGKIWSSLGLTDNLFRGKDEVTVKEEEMDPFAGVASPMCQSYKTGSIYYLGKDHDPMVALERPPPEIAREFARLRFTIRNMTGTVKACAQSFFNFMKEVIPADNTLKEILQRYDDFKGYSKEDRKHVTWAWNEANEPDSIVHDLFETNRYIALYIDSWQGVHDHGKKSSLICPKLQEQLHQIIHDIHTLPTEEKMAALSFRSFLKENPQLASTETFTEVVELTEKHFYQLADEGIQVSHTTLQWLEAQTSSPDSCLAKRMWNFFVDLHAFLEKKLQWSQKMAFWQLPANLTDAIRELKYEIKRLTNDTERDAAWNFKHFLWQSNLTDITNITELSPDFDQFLSDQRSMGNATAVYTWFTNGIYVNNSFVARMTYALQKCREYKRIGMELPEAIKKVKMSLFSDFVNLNQSSKNAAFIYKQFMKEYNGSNHVSDFTKAFQRFLNDKQLEEQEIWDWFDKEAYSGNSLASRLFQVTKEIKEFKAQKYVEWKRQHPDNSTAWGSKWSWKNRTANSLPQNSRTHYYNTTKWNGMGKYGHGNATRKPSNQWQNSDVGRYTGYNAQNGSYHHHQGSHNSSQHHQGHHQSGQHHSYKPHHQKPDHHKHHHHKHHHHKKHEWYSMPWFFNYLSTDLQEDIEEMMDEACTVCPVTQRRYKYIKAFFKDFNGRMGENAAIDLEKYLEEQFGGFLDSSSTATWFRKAMSNNESFPARLVMLHDDIMEFLDDDEITMDQWSEADPSDFHKHFNFHGHHSHGSDGDTHDHSSSGPVHNGPMRIVMDQLPDDLQRKIHVFWHSAEHLDPLTKRILHILNQFMLETKWYEDGETLTALVPSVQRFTREAYGNTSLVESVTNWMMLQDKQPDSVGQKLMEVSREIRDYLVKYYHPGMDAAFAVITDMSRLKRRLMMLDDEDKQAAEIFRMFLRMYMHSEEREVVADMDGVEELYPAFANYIHENYGLDSYRGKSALDWFKEDMNTGNPLVDEMVQTGAGMAALIDDVCGEASGMVSGDVQVSVYDAMIQFGSRLQDSLKKMLARPYNKQDIPTMLFTRVIEAAKQAGVMDLSRNTGNDGVKQCMCT